MVQHRVNRPQQYTKTPKEAIIEAIKSRTLRAKKPTVKKIQAKPKILTEEDI